MDKQKVRIISIITVVLLIIGSGVFYYYHYTPQSASEAEIPQVTASPISEKSVIVSKKYIGYVTPVNQVIVQPYLAGFIDQIWVAGGQKVVAGEKLLRLEQAEYKAALMQAKATSAKAKADFNYAADYYARMQKAGSNAVSQSEIENAKAQFLASRAALAQADAGVAQALVNLGYTTIYATIDGTVGDVSLTKGDYVSPESQLLSIVQTTPTRVVFSISDKDYLEELSQSTMFKNEPIRLILANGKLYDFEGVFRYTDNKINRSTNAVAVYVDFENPQKELLDNAYVTVLVDKKYQGVIVAKDLVHLRPEGSFIYVAEGDWVKKHTVEILSEYGDKYILQNNFATDSNIVLEKISLRNSEQKMQVVTLPSGEKK